MISPPLMTLALTTWNHERFVEAAMLAALAQTYTPLEILVSDDASTDGTWAIVQRLAENYRGPHRLRLNRNERNLGVGAHTDLVMELAQGDVVVLAAGDDISEEDRVSAIAKEWQTDPDRILCIGSQARAIDESGKEGELLAAWPFGPDVDAATLARTGGGILGATLAVHRRLLHRFGPLGADIRTCEDVVLPLRAALLGKVIIIPQPLVKYRRHGQSLMGAVTPVAGSGTMFAAGIERMLRGELAARRRQLADLQLASDAVPASGKIQAALALLLEKSETIVSLSRGQRGAVPRLFKLSARGVFSAGETIKLLLMTRLPRLWYRYIAWRHAQRLG